MQRWKEFFRSDPTFLSRPTTILRFITLAIFIFALGLALLMPLSGPAYLKMIIAVIAGLGYTLIAWMPYLPGRRTLIDVYPIGIALLNALFYGFVTYLLFDVIPVIAIIYVLPIISGAIRRGRRFALLNAFLASVSYWVVLQILGAQTLLWNDWLVFTVFFGMHALLAGSLATTLEQRTIEYKNIVHYSRDAIVILNHAGQIEYLNPAALNLCGYPPEELWGRPFFDLIVPAERTKAFHAWKNLLAGVIPDETFVVQILTKTGAPRTLAITTAPFDLKRNRFAIFARDITAQEKQQQEHEHRHRELDAERAVATAISQTLTLEEVLRVALAKVLETLQYDAGAIYLADEAQTTLTLAIAQNLSDEFTRQFLTHTFGHGITGRAAAQREILVENILPACEQTTPLADGGSLRTQISVPLIYQDRVMGVLNINSRQAQTLPPTDLALLRTIAATLAVAIDRARLFETLEQRVAQRTAELATLNRIAAVSNQSLDLAVILDATLVELIRALQVEGGWIFQIHREQGTLQMLAQRGVPAVIFDQPPLLRLGEGAIGQVALESHGRLVDIEQLEPLARERLLTAGIQSICVVTLVAHNQTIGVLSLFSRQKNRFGETELRWLDSVGNTVAVAMQNAQLFESEKRAREKAEVLRKAAYAISSSLKLDQVLRLLLEQLKSVLTYDTASILLLREPDQPLLVSGIGYANETITSQLASHLLRTSPILAQMARDLQPVIIADVREHPGWIWVPGAEHVRSFLAVPIISRDKMIGALMADSVHVNFFKTDDVQHAQTLAPHIAVALQNAQLFESVEQQLKQIMTLREIDRTLNSMLELEPMLDTILDAVAQLVPYDYAAIFILEGNRLRAVAAHGIRADHWRHLVFDISVHPGFHRIWNKRRPVILPNVRNSKEWLPTPGLEDVQSWLGVPFIARDQVLGQLSLYHRAPHAFTQKHSDLIWAFANHAAIAIANARLRAELHEQARHDSLTQVLNHGAFVNDLRLASEHAVTHHQGLALIMIDLDDFKQYNDTYGHVVGDEVLRTTVQAIRAHIKQTDLVGRWGGEEFGIALPNANSAQAMLVAERIRKTLATTKIQDRHGMPIPPPTVSQGIAVLGQTAKTLDDLIEQADRALYRAKQRGKDQIVCAQ